MSPAGTRNATSSALTGQDAVKAFLEELFGYVSSAPGGEVIQTPREIVESVVARTTRFCNCNDDTINNLVRQVCMAVKTKGSKFGLRVRTLKSGQLHVIAT